MARETTAHTREGVKHFKLGGTILIGRAKRAPHWGVQSRFRSVCRSVCMSVVVQKA